MGFKLSHFHLMFRVITRFGRGSYEFPLRLWCIPGGFLACVFSCCPRNLIHACTPARPTHPEEHCVALCTRATQHSQFSPALGLVFGTTDSVFSLLSSYFSSIFASCFDDFFHAPPEELYLALCTRQTTQPVQSSSRNSLGMTHCFVIVEFPLQFLICFLF